MQHWLPRGTGQAKWLRPRHVDLDKRCIVTALRPKPEELLITKERDDLLHLFINLAKVKDTRIRTFVERWGRLGLCFHHRLPRGAAVHQQDGGRECFQGMHTGLRERTDTYRGIASQFRDVQQIARKIEKRRRAEAQRGPSRQRRPLSFDALPAPEASDRHGTPREDWLVFSDLFDDLDLHALLTYRPEPLPQPLSGVEREIVERAKTIPLSLGDEQRMLASVLTRLLNRAEAGLAVEWQPHQRRPDLTVAGEGLLGVLTIRLLLDTSGLALLPSCEECGLFYRPERRDTRNRWCPGCRQAGVPKREEMRRYRARRAAAPADLQP